MKLVVVILSTLAVSSFAQRSPYAGRNPVGYPEMDISSTTTTQSSDIDDRFGEDATPATTERLPLEANGDRDLVNRLRKLPLDKQPFWLINWLALENMRNNPQTYDHLPNAFIEPSWSSSQNAQNRRL